MADSSMNMMEISMDRLLTEIKYDIEDGNYDPVIILGPSGVGKTMGVYGLTQELGIGFCEMRLVTMTEVDILGIPKEDEYGRTTFASNTLLPVAERDGEVGILVLDEITSASNTVRAASYQLMDSKRAIGNYKLPEKWKVIALGNGEEDGGVFSGMESAFLSRAGGGAYRVEPDLNAWRKWALHNNMHPTILAFLAQSPEYLHKFDTEEIAAVFPCPRSWAALSKKLNLREKRNGGTLDQDDVQVLAGGTVGANVSPLYSAFYAYQRETINIEDIINGDATTDLSSMREEAISIVIQALITEVSKRMDKVKAGALSHEQAVGIVANVLRWCIAVSKQKLEYAMSVIKELVNNSTEFMEIVIMDEDGELAKQCPEFNQFVDDVGFFDYNN